MDARDELVQAVAEVLRAHQPEGPSCPCGWRPDWAAQPFVGWIAQYDAHQAAAVVDALGERLAAAWDEGARAAWERSGEGWNGEYPDDAEPWEPDTSPNPYRTTTERTEDR